MAINTPAPKTNLPAAPSSPSNNPRGTFVFGSNDATASFQVSLDGGAYTTATSPYSTGVLADGSHTFSVRATDPAGNTDATPATHTWTIDTRAPNTTITVFEPNPTH